MPVRKDWQYPNTNSISGQITAGYLAGNKLKKAVNFSIKNAIALNRFF